MTWMGRRRAILIGSCVEATVVGAEFGLFSGLVKVMDLIYSFNVKVGNSTRFKT